MIVSTHEAEDPNGEGTFKMVHIALLDEEVLEFTANAKDGSRVVTFYMPLGYADQLGGKLLENAKESKND